MGANFGTEQTVLSSVVCSFFVESQKKFLLYPSIDLFIVFLMEKDSVKYYADF